MNKVIKIYLHNYSIRKRYFMQSLEHNQGATVITEHNRELFVQGKAKIYTKYIQTNLKGEFIQNAVFYNPVQIFNRDFTVLVMQGYINQLKAKKAEKFQGVKIVDALSASGLRTIRFLKQLQGVKIVYANDISPAAHKLMKDNFDLNNLNEQNLKITIEDANMLLLNQKKNIIFDIIDLDPYGSVVPFLDASVQSIKDGGLLCITCTDTKVLCGPDISKCYYYYGTTRSRVHHFNENALRIALNTVSSAASRHCKYIEPVISFQTDFYIRIFVIVRKGRKQCAQSGTKIGNVFNCTKCGNYQYHTHFIQKANKSYAPNKTIINNINCPLCKNQFTLNGPIWLGEINSLPFVEYLKQMMENKQFKLDLKTHKKLYGVLHGILQQKQLSKIPLGFNFDLMCKNIKSSTPNRKFLYSGLQSLGYKIQPSYISPGLYKTNASFKVIYDLIKCWKMKNVGEQKYMFNIKQQFSLNLLKQNIQYKPDFQFKIQKHQQVPKFISMGDHMGPKGKPESRLLTKEEVKELQREKEKTQSTKEKQKQQEMVDHNNGNHQIKLHSQQIKQKQKQKQTKPQINTLGSHKLEQLPKRQTRSKSNKKQ